MSKFYFGYIIFIFCGTFLRFWNIGGIEPFVDEAYNVLSAQGGDYLHIADSVGQGRSLVSVLFIIPVWLAQQVGSDILLASRVQTSLVGLINALLITSIVKMLFGNFASLLACFIWAINPFLFFHDRFALQDPHSCLFLLIAMFFWLRANRSTQISAVVIQTIISALCMALVLFNKISGLLVLPWLICFYLMSESKDNRYCRRVVFVCATACALFPLLLQMPELGSALFDWGHFGAQEMHDGEQSFLLSLSSISSTFGIGLKAYFSSLVGYQGLLFLILSCIGMFVAAWSWPQMRLFRIGYVLSVVGEGLAFNDLAYPRYYLVDMIPLTIFICAGLAAIQVHLACFHYLRPFILTSWCILILGIPWGSKAINFLTDPHSSSHNDWRQGTDYTYYMENLASGRGVNHLIQEMKASIDSDAQNLIFVHGGHHSTPRALELAFFMNKKVSIIPICPTRKNDTGIVFASMANKPTKAIAGYIVVPSSPADEDILSIPPGLTESASIRMSRPLENQNREYFLDLKKIQMTAPFVLANSVEASQFPTSIVSSPKIEIEIFAKKIIKNIELEFFIPDKNDYEFGDIAITFPTEREMKENDDGLKNLIVAHKFKHGSYKAEVNLAPGYHRLNILNSRWWHTRDRKKRACGYKLWYLAQAPGLRSLRIQYAEK